MVDLAEIRSRGLHYMVADVIMVIEGSDKTAVTAISFDRIHPYWLIDALMKQ